MKRWVSALVLVLASTSAWADNWRSAFIDPADEVLWLRTVNGISITTIDDVIDGCWTNADAVEDAIELSLRRAGIDVIDMVDGIFVPHLIFNVTGYDAVAGACVAVLEFSFEWLVPSDAVVSGGGSWVIIRPLSAGYILSGQGAQNDQIRSWAIEMTDALALRILRARDSE